MFFLVVNIRVFVMIWVIENGINLDFISGCLNDENGNF